ncbi:MAG: DUF3467 domain-containing protein [Anaerolineae bacterium]|nr:DUF3467 domain-containing protein [Anaerolineae bacterium]
MQPKQRKIKLEMPKDPSGTYANTVMISHNKNEAFFDFIQILPHDPRAKVQQRIIMNPTSAKLFLKALQENVAKYEEKFGEIETPQRPPSLADQLFGVVSGEGDNNGQS